MKPIKNIKKKLTLRKAENILKDFDRNFSTHLTLNAQGDYHIII